MNVILIGIVAMVAIIWLVPAIPVNPIGALIIVIFGFFFATVSSRMVGLVGSSNNPVSGMAIATLLNFHNGDQRKRTDWNRWYESSYRYRFCYLYHRSYRW